MVVHEIRDFEASRRFLLEGLWLPRAAPPRPATVRPALGWLLELATGGEPVPPVGFVADVGLLALGIDREGSGGPRAMPAVPGWPSGLSRAYEDRVLGKLDADRTFARASDALARYQGRDQARGLAFLIDQFRRRAGLGGVLLNPSAIKATLESPAEGAMAEGWEILGRDGPSALMIALYEDLLAKVRDAGEVLGPEDVFELEHGTALAPFGQRVAMRQVLQAASDFEAGVALSWPRPPERRRDVPTRVLDEDQYPVGGFSSISTRGSVESLLHSQLAYMEPHERPDLFDIKYLRDELLYYARDENQFLRQRRTYLFALHPDLARSRFKDAELPRQRIVLLLALLVAAVRTLTDWLSADALRFEFLFLHEADDDPLAPERVLIETILREPIAAGTVATEQLPVAHLAGRCESRARRSLCHCLTVATVDRHLAAETALITRLRLDGPRPRLAVGDEDLTVPEADDAPASWQAALDRLLTTWV